MAMQSYVSRVQRKLDEHISDALEWEEAQNAAVSEKHSESDLLCECGAKSCPQGEEGCAYWEAAQNIFAMNSDSFSRRRLAHVLRAIMVAGPSKQNRVPFLVGPSNTGKSTLLYPFDDLFTTKKVLHKPALGSTLALRNIVKKRFIFWDDYRPVEYAHERTIPVSLFLSLFIGQPTEIQVSQAFNDGNMDVAWAKGVVFTAKSDGLWEPTKRVGEEDIRHMRNSVEEFVFVAELPRGVLKDIQPCAVHIARWIMDESAAADASSGLRALPVEQQPAGSAERVEAGDGCAVAGFREFAIAAKLPLDVSQTLLRNLVDIGALGVEELTSADWQSLPSWRDLRMLQKRHLTQALFGQRALQSWE